MTQVVLAAVLGALFALGTFLVLRKDLVRVVWGVAIMSQAANVYLVTMGGVEPVEVAPIVYEGTTDVADPLVQALVLTAIVISFGTTAFALALTVRVYQEHGSIEMDRVGRGGREGVGGGVPAADGGPASGASGTSWDERGESEGGPASAASGTSSDEQCESDGGAQQAGPADATDDDATRGETDG